MREIIIEEKEAGQRLDKFLKRYLKEAPDSFLYKMLRKKNITLNKKRAEGKEILQKADVVSLFLSEETVEKFSKTKEREYRVCTEGRQAYAELGALSILWENTHVLLVNKPAGLLSQKAKKDDVSLNEWLVGRLLHTGELFEADVASFRPSVCNRLDRNTSGIVLCAKTLHGSRELGRLLKDRSLKKYYRMYVEGEISRPKRITGYFLKEEASNRVWITKEPPVLKGRKDQRASRIETAYTPLAFDGETTYTEVELITGKSHQIRAHLASIGHPLVGDFKYGNPARNRKWKEQFGITHQLLHACRLEFPQMEGPLSDMSRLTVCAPLPEVFEQFEKGRKG